MEHTKLPVAIVGAGPIGLAAAAHLHERGESFIVIERASSVAGNVASWGHVRVFSPWSENIDAAARRLLADHDWVAPDPAALPTGHDLIREYLAPLSSIPAIGDHCVFGATVASVGRQYIDKMKNAGRADAPFELQIAMDDGSSRLILARAVIDASGTWASPNPIGAGGVAAIGEAAVGDRVMYGIPDVKGRDRVRYADKRVMVVGSGHSAFQTLLDLAAVRAEAPATQVMWSLRSTPTMNLFGGGEADALPARGALGLRLRQLIDDGAITVLAGNRIRSVELVSDGVSVTTSDDVAVEVDEIVAVTGSRPNLEMIRELRIAVDPITEAVAGIASHIDPNFHSCGTVPAHGERELRQREPGFYVVGMKSYGRAPTFLMLTGYEQVRSVVAALAGDMEAAARVELALPETGVCNGDPGVVYDLGEAHVPDPLAVSCC